MGKKNYSLPPPGLRANLLQQFSFPLIRANITVMDTFQPIDTTQLEESTYTQAHKEIEKNNFSGLDPVSIRKLIFFNPLVLLAALSQKISDLILFPMRLGWAAMTPQERNRFPWLNAALEWGLTSEELYLNAHGLPDKHHLKKPALTAAKDMEHWEKAHPNFSFSTKDSKTLDRLIGQPVPIGSDGWPLNKLDDEGDELPLEELYEQTHLLYHRIKPYIPKNLENNIRWAAQQALQDERLVLISN